MSKTAKKSPDGLTWRLVRKTWVTLTHPTITVTKGKHHPWDGERDPYTVETPPDICAIQFYDTIQSTARVNDDGSLGDTYAEDENGILLNSDMFNASPFYWIRGKKLYVTDKEFREEKPGVVQQLEQDGYNSCINIGTYHYPFDNKRHQLLKDYVRRTNNGKEGTGGL